MSPRIISEANASTVKFAIHDGISVLIDGGKIFPVANYQDFKDTISDFALTYNVEYQLCSGLNFTNRVELVTVFRNFSAADAVLHGQKPVM
jgi:hypothetical protein